MSCREAELARLAEEAWRQILPFHDGDLSGQPTPEQMAGMAFDYAEAFLVEREHREADDNQPHIAPQPLPSVGSIFGDTACVDWVRDQENR